MGVVVCADRVLLGMGLDQALEFALQTLLILE